MNTKTFTQGKWEQNYICAGSTNEIKAKGKRIALVFQYNENQEQIADYDECTANAKLMAAAPELFISLNEVIKTLVAGCATVRDQKAIEDSDVIKAARAAIAKALK